MTSVTRDPKLVDFIASNRKEILERVRAQVAARPAKDHSEDAELNAGLPIFLDQLATSLGTRSAKPVAEHESITRSAGVHGGRLWSHGFSVTQVVHDYGAICQVVTELAVEQRAPIRSEDFRTLNLCLDDAIAGAVDEYARQRERTIRDEGTERLGVLAHELRNLLNTALLAYDSVKTGAVALNGSTSLILGRSLLGLRNLVNQSLADVRLGAGMENIEPVVVREVLEEVEITAAVLARAKEIDLTIDLGEPSLVVEADRQLLTAAVANLVQNAFKFTRKKGSVSLRAHATHSRVLIDVEDECGGLPPGKAEELFHPHTQRGGDLTGLGLGLSIVLKTVRSVHGEVRVKNIPGKGCVFSIDLPQHRSAGAASS